MIAIQAGGFDSVEEQADGSLFLFISFYVQSVGWCSARVTIKPTFTTDDIRAAMLQAMLDHAAEKGVKLEAGSVLMSGTVMSVDAVPTAVLTAADAAVLAVPLA
jgi:hypothetical protein